MKLIVGLGNPGKEYDKTRHNVGFALVDAFKGNEGAWEDKGKFKSDVIKITFGNQDVLLAKPQTGMNSSGEAVSLIVNFYKIDPSNVLTVHDDLDIPLGSHKLQFGKGPACHNGILDIEQKLGTKDFWRLRVGVENRPGVVGAERALPVKNGEEYVLAKFTNEELEVLESETPQILERLRGWVRVTRD